MLQIRSEQMEVFERTAWQRFEDDMVRHCEKFSPRLYAVLGEDQTRVAVRRELARADGYGFSKRGPLRLFLEMALLFGCDFDTDPQYPWAAKSLHRAGDQMARADRLYDQILDYQAKVCGPNNTNVRKALEDLLVFARQPLVFPPEDIEVGLIREMRRLFPTKADYLGDTRLGALVREGRTVALLYRFNIRGEVVVATLMFAFGHGCTDDPFYPWIRRTLRDERITDPTSRVERLERKAVTWLEHVLDRRPTQEFP